MALRSADNVATFGAGVGKLQQSKVLLVGAGGIGCELLKNLLLVGVGEIVVIDLDTIDLSNLNRQFLFRKQHIKRSKAQVAVQTASAFNPDCRLRALHANIKDDEFNYAWFRQFDAVFNALDNLDARRHVNRMCVATRVPLVESGTTGFHGQVQVIVSGATECYDCVPKPTPKTFPVCTIRSTPSQLIHCVVWAKSYLLSELFGVSEAESADVDRTETADNDEIQSLKLEAKELLRLRESMGSAGFARNVFSKVFERDVQRLRSVPEMWKHRTMPIPLEFDELARDGCVNADKQAVRTVQENVATFVDAVNRLAARALAQKSAIDFDKDDEDVMAFVAATANLRAVVFGIDRKSEFDIKEMAGNIIPAIATTNAIVAGVCVLHGVKVLTQGWEHLKMVFLSRRADRVFNFQGYQPPNPACHVCSAAYAPLQCNPSHVTIKNIVDFARKTGYSEEISIMSDRLFYDVDFDDNLHRTLAELGIHNGAFLSLVDEQERDSGLRLRTLNLCIVTDESVHGMIEPAVKVDLVRNVGEEQQQEGDDEPPTAKRKHDSDEGDVVESKRHKPESAAPAVITIDEDQILID